MKPCYGVKTSVWKLRICSLLHYITPDNIWIGNDNTVEVLIQVIEYLSDFFLAFLMLTAQHL